MDEFHAIVPNGDVDLILQYSEQLGTPVDDVFEDMHTPSQPDFSRSGLDNQLGELRRMQRKDREEWAPRSPVYDEESKVDANIEEASTVTEADTDLSSNSNENCVRIRVSSKHLARASAYFKRNLNSGMLESTTLRFEGRVDFPMQDEDPEAMLIIMNIIHGRRRQVPRSVSLDLLTKIATSVDYLECLEMVEPYSDKWISALLKNVATTYSKALIQWLCVSLTFRKEGLFTALTRIIIRQAKGPMQTLDLPIRGSVVGEFASCIKEKHPCLRELSEKINQIRHHKLDGAFSCLDVALERFREEHADCIIERDSMRYGVLMKKLESYGLSYPHPQIPFLGLSFDDLIQTFSRLRDPQWRDLWDGIPPQDHVGELRLHILRLVHIVDANVQGLYLFNFI